jgi:hypothetical protein
VEPGEVGPGQAEHVGDDRHGERQGELAHEVGPAGVDELVDVGVDGRGDDLRLPVGHGLAAEHLLQDVAVGVVLGLVHHEDGVAEDRPHDLLVATRGERPPVAEHRAQGLVAADREDVGHVRLVERGVVVEAHELADVGPHHPPVAPQLGEVRVGVLDPARPHRPVELLEGVVVGADVGDPGNGLGHGSTLH